jgi:hypothetical protein
VPELDSGRSSYIRELDQGWPRGLRRQALGPGHSTEQNNQHERYRQEYCAIPGVHSEIHRRKQWNPFLSLVLGAITDSPAFLTVRRNSR